MFKCYSSRLTQKSQRDVGARMDGSINHQLWIIMDGPRGMQGDACHWLLTESGLAGVGHVISLGNINLNFASQGLPYPPPPTPQPSSKSAIIIGTIITNLLVDMTLAVRLYYLGQHLVVSFPPSPAMAPIDPFHPSTWA